MTRTLPWLIGKSGDGESSKRPRPGQRQARLKSTSDDGDEVVAPRRPASEVRARRQARTPSTSPPPAPPPDEPMREGLLADDGYIMVEDEFLAVAQKYTQHLHHAEYVRLKQVARSKNASTLSSVVRPVDTRTGMSEELKRSKRSEAPLERQKEALEDLLPQDKGEEDLELDGEDDPWVGTSLFGLMTSPKRGQRTLAGIHGVKSTGRAAAGHVRLGPGSRERTVIPSIQHNDRIDRLGLQDITHEGEVDDTEDDEDLDAPIVKPVSRTRLGKISAVGQVSREECSVKSHVTKDRLSQMKSSSPPSDHLARLSPSCLKSRASRPLDAAPVDVKARHSGQVQSSHTVELKRKKSALLGEIPTFLF